MHYCCEYGYITEQENITFSVWLRKNEGNMKHCTVGCIAYNM